MSDIEGALTKLVRACVKRIKKADTRPEADDAALQLMRYEEVYVNELKRKGRLISADGKLTVNTAPDRSRVEDRLGIVRQGLREAERIYKDKGWNF